MSSNIPASFLHRIPKSDLHLHLDGSLRLSSLIEMARASRVELPSYEEEGLRELVFKERYADLPEYLRPFALTCAVLQTPEHLERSAYELATDCLEEGVRYIEVRFAPQLHQRGTLTVSDVLDAVNRGFARARREHNGRAEVMDAADIPFEYGIIACALRFFDGRFGAYFEQLLRVLSESPRQEVFAMASLELARSAVRARDERGIPVVGFDLAGAEAGYPAGYHREAYQYAHEHFMKKTVHAGEAYGPESIFQAITDCHANRIGHGTHLFDAAMVKDPAIADREGYVDSLAEYIASERIGIEVCLTSNLQTLPWIGTVDRHPVSRMIARNLSVSICTDNRLVSGTTVTRELDLLVRGTGISRRELKNVIVAGFKSSFFPGSYNEKRLYVRQAMTLYERIEAGELRGNHGGGAT